MKRLKWICLLSFYLQSFVSTSQTIQLLDSNEKGIEGVLALYNNSFLLGISDSNGTLDFQNKQIGKSVLLHRLGYQDTTISLKSNITIELKQKSYQLKAVNVFEESISPFEKLLKFVSFNVKRMGTEKVDIPFGFITKTTVPDSNWNEVRKGELSLNYNSYDKKGTKVWNSTYCDFMVEVDSAYWFYPKRKELVLGTLIGMFEKDGFRKNRLLRNLKFEKEFNVDQKKSSEGYVFELTTKGKSKMKQHAKVIFSLDSAVVSYEYRWLNELDEPINAGLKKAKHLQHYSFWEYTKQAPVSIDSVHSKVSFISKSGLGHEVDFRAKRSDEVKPKKCLNLSIFLEFNPQQFRKRGLLERVSYK